MSLVYKSIKYSLISMFIIIIFIFFTPFSSLYKMTVYYYLQNSDFNQVKEVYSKKWSDFHYCKYSDGSKVINNINISKNNEDALQEFYKVGKQINITLSESYFEPVFKIGGTNCFFGESEYFLIETSNGSMDYYIGYAYFHNEKSIPEITKKLYKSKIYSLRHGSKYKLTELNSGWYIYEHIH